MLRLGFCSDWVNTVMDCVESATFSFIINNNHRAHCSGERSKTRRSYFSVSLFVCY